MPAARTRLFATHGRSGSFFGAYQSAMRSRLRRPTVASVIRATSVLAQGTWPGRADDTVVLDLDDRHRRRLALVGVRGLSFLLDLREAVVLRSGDALLLEDDRRVEVLAAPEALVEVRAGGEDTLVRLAWHLGNRHLPTQILGRALRIRRDPVIEAMLIGLGARVTPIEAPFDPEGGAYAGSRGHGHDHGSHAH